MTTTTTTETDSIKQHLATMGVTDAATRDKVLGIGLSWPYYVRLLDETHIPAMLALQEAGGDGQILDRDAQTLTAHFNAGQTAMGVFHQGELVAQSLITTGLAAPGTLPVAGALSKHFMTQSIMGGVVVSPTARGQGLMDTMVRIWLNQAEKGGIDIVHARVRPANEKSWQVFMRNGLAITSVGPSPDHPNHNVYYLHKPLKAAFALQDGIVHGYAAQRGGIHSWLDRGYIATGWNKNQRSFMLARATPAPAL